MSAEDPQHTLNTLQARLSAVEDERAVRNVLARYMTLCDQPCTEQDPSELGDLFSPDAIWEGIGTLYTQTFGRQVGRDAIAEFLGSYLAPRSSHFTMNAHFLSSDVVTVDGNSAHGQWAMQQISTYADGRTELIGARLSIDFCQQDGSWKIRHFRTQRLYCLPGADTGAANHMKGN